MAEVTQQSDQYLFECATSSSEAAPNISKGKSMAYVVDLNQGSYNSGIVSIDATNQINGAKGFASLRDSYITVPYVVSLNNVSGTVGSASAVTEFIGALKANTATVIDKVQIEVNGKTLVTPTGYLSHWNNLRAMTEWSDDDVKVHGPSALMFPDNVNSIGFNNGVTTSGDGYYNNNDNVTNALSIGNNSVTPEWLLNDGFVKRQLCNPPVVTSNGTSINSFGWGSTHQNAFKTLCQNSGKGCIVVGTGGATPGSVAQIFYLLRIRLVDIHPIFKTFDLVANPQLKLTLYFNTGSSVITTDVSKNMRLTSTTLTQGNTCPFLISSAASGCGMASVLTANVTTLNLAWGVMGNSLTTSATAGNYYPYSTCRLYIPFYDLQPEKELQIVKSPKKTVRYLDYFVQSFKGQAGTGISTTGPINSNFSLQLSGTLKNVKYVALIPFVNTSADASNYTTGTTNIDQYASPFDSAPWTFQPGSLITNFNVQIGNQWLFNNSSSYDFSSFLDEFVKIGSVYGSLEHQISNGLIGEDSWMWGNRVMIADVSRLSNKDISQSILITGTNSCSQGTDFICLAVYEKEFELDRVVGTVELI